MCVYGGGLIVFFFSCLPLTQKLAGKAQRHPTRPVLENSGTQMQVYTNFAILDGAHSDSVIHSRPCLPGGLYRFVSCVEAVPGKNSILLIVNWTLPPRKPGVLRFCFWNRYQEQATVLQDTQEID